MRKKLFAILMSAMMMVTFMPAMAFAYVDPTPAPTPVVHTEAHKATNAVLRNVEWGEQYGTATADLVCGVKDCPEVLAHLTATTVERVMDANGIITATATFVEPETKGELTAEAKFIDVTGAKLLHWKGGAADNCDEITELGADNYLTHLTTTATGTTFNYVATGLANCVKLGKPAYATGATAAYVLPDNTNFKVTLAPAAYEAYEDGDYTFAVTVENKMTDKTASNYVDVIGTIADKTVAIKTDALGCVTMALDGTARAFTTSGQKYLTTGTNTVLGFTYDGAEHVLSVANKGVKVEYKEYNAADTTYTTTAPVIKNYGTYKYEVKVTKEFAVASNITKEFTVQISVGQKAMTYGFKQSLMDVPYGQVMSMADVLNVAGICESDVEAMDVIFAKLYEIPGFFTTLGQGNLELKAKANPETLTAAETALWNNYTAAPTTANSMTLKISKQEATSVKISTSKATVKKSKVKKAAQKVTVKTSNNVGAKVTLKKVSGSKKLSVKSGKIVVKKGTKKGTYKIKVKASVAGTNSYVKASTTKTIKVVVK